MVKKQDVLSSVCLFIWIYLYVVLLVHTRSVTGSNPVGATIVNPLRINVLKGFSFWQEKATGYADGGEDALCQQLGEAGFAACKICAGTIWPRHDSLSKTPKLAASAHKQRFAARPAARLRPSPALLWCLAMRFMAFSHFWR